MKRILARTLLNYSIEQLWEMLTGRFILVFDDALEIEVTDQDAMLSRYYWEYHIRFPKLPLLYRHYVGHYYKSGYFANTSHCAILGVLYKDTIDSYTTIENQHNVSENCYDTLIIYQITNRIYNDYVIKTKRYARSISILDYIELYTHPPIHTAIIGTKSTQKSITATNNTISNVIAKDLTISHNPIVHGCRTGALRERQIVQCIGARGYPTDTNYVVMQEPIVRGYLQGMRSMYDILAESRSALKSILLTDAPLKNSEYFSRRLQLLCESVRNLHRVDCGSTKYLQIRIKPPTYMNGKKTYDGDLYYMTGKYYLDPETNKLKYLTMDDTHLYNKVIKMRSVIYCQHKDKYGVCSVCFGRLSDNIVDFSNIGHETATTTGKQEGQGILSNKHYEGSSHAEPIELSEEQRKVFVSMNNTSFYVKPELKKSNLKLILHPEEAYGLTDLLEIDNIHNIIPDRISSINTMVFEITQDKTTTPYAVGVTNKDKNSVLSLEFLLYLRDKKWTITPSGYFCVDMSEWDYKQPISTTPELEHNFAQHSAQIARLIEGNMKVSKQRARPESVEQLLMELLTTINAKLYVHMSIIEIIVYALMVDHDSKSGKDLARNATNYGLGTSEKLLLGRSLSCALAYESHVDTLSNPTTFFAEGKPDHPMDVLFLPEQVIRSKQQRII